MLTKSNRSEPGVHKKLNVNFYIYLSTIDVVRVEYGDCNLS